MIDRRLAKQVRRHRQARGLTRQALGNRLGVSSRQIQAYEAGTVRIAPGLLIDIATVLGIKPIELFQEPAVERGLLH